MKFAAIAPVYLSLAVVLPCAFSSTGADVQPVRQLSATGQKTAGNQSETPGGEPSRRVSFGRNIETSAGSRQTIRSEASLNDYSAYRVGDHYYVTLPQASAAGDMLLPGGRAYTEMRVERRGADVLISYLMRPGFSARVEQRFGRLDVVFEDNGGRTNATRQRQGAEASGEARAGNSPATTPPNVANRKDSLSPPGELRAHETVEKPDATPISPQPTGESTQPQPMSPTPPLSTPVTKGTGDSQLTPDATWKALLQKWEFAVPAALLVITCIVLLISSRRLKTRMRRNVGDGLAHPATSTAEPSSAVSDGAARADEETLVSEEPDTLMNPASPAVKETDVVGPEQTKIDEGATHTSASHVHAASPGTQREMSTTDTESKISSVVSEAAYTGVLLGPFGRPDSTEDDADVAVAEPSSVGDDATFESICAAFDDEGGEIRSAAARALYGLSKNPVESFGRALREATPGRRREIGAAIASSGLAGESLARLTGESRERTYEAFSLLFLMAKAGEVQLLLRAIEGHPNNEVRLAVVKLLALSGQKEVLPAFRRLKTRSSLPAEVRDAIADAIDLLNSQTQT